MGVLKVDDGTGWRKVGCGSSLTGRLRMQLPDLSWVREVCDDDPGRTIDDDFNRTTLVNVLTHTFTGSNGSTIGAADTGQAVSNPGWTISGNTAVDLTTINESFLTADTGSPDGTFTVKLTAVPSLGDGGLAVRTDSSGNNCWLLNVETGSRYGFYKRVSGGYTFVTAVAKVPAVGDVLKVVCDGNTLTPSVGSVIGSTVTDSTHATQSLIGMRASNASSAKDIAFDDLTAGRLLVGNGWTTVSGGIVSGEAKGVFGRDLTLTADFDLTYTVPAGISSFMTVNFGMASDDLNPPAEFHRIIMGSSFGGEIQIQYRNTSGTISSYNGPTVSATFTAGDQIRVRVADGWISAYINGTLATDGPLATTFTGTWLMIDTANGDSTSTTTVDDLHLTVLYGHPLKIEDPANPGTWITVACMVAAYGWEDVAPDIGWFSYAGGGDFVEEPTATYRTTATRAARVGGLGGTGNYGLDISGLTVGHTYRAGCYIRNDRAVQATTSDAVFGAAATTLGHVNPVPLPTWELAEGTFVATATTETLVWQIAMANAAPPYDFSVWLADWYVIDEGP